MSSEIEGERERERELFLSRYYIAVEGNNCTNLEKEWEKEMKTASGVDSLSFSLSLSISLPLFLSVCLSLFSHSHIHTLSLLSGHLCPFPLLSFFRASTRRSMAACHPTCPYSPRSPSPTLSSSPATSANLRKLAGMREARDT